MFLTIKNDQNLSVHDGTERRMFGQGIHEISESMAETIEAMNLRWARVTVNRPNIQITGHADIGPLTKEQLEHGQEGAATKRLADIVAEREAARKAAEVAGQPLPDPAANFPCPEAGCGTEFPSVPALERHVEMNHTPVLAVEGDESEGEVVIETVIEGSAEGSEIRARAKGDGLGALRKGERYAKSE